jgi:hypothetical protein
MPSSSVEASCKPHIGSLGCGGFFAAMPESQWPDLPTQQGIAFELFAETAIGTNAARNDRATKRHKEHKMPCLNCLCFWCLFVAI